jgi:hypothetical protein
VPTVESVICNPDGVVMVFPAVCAVAGVTEADTEITLKPAKSKTAKTSARRKARIPFSLMETP